MTRMTQSVWCDWRLLFSGLFLLTTSVAHAAPSALHVSVRTNQVLISWSAQEGDFVLQATDGLSPKATWWPTRFAVKLDQGLYSVTVSPAASRRFYRLATNDYVSWFQTVQGPIPAMQQGVVLPHEHIFTDLRGPTTPGYGQADEEDVVRVMKPLLVEARDRGVDVLVECSSIGVGRNVGVIQRLSQESGLFIVVPTGVYGRANFAPPAHRDMSEDELASLFTSEIRDGIEGSSIKAGFIKISTSDTALTELEEKFLRAAGRAARETGAVVASHTVSGAVARKQADILESISPAIRFIWVHAQVEQNRRIHRELAARGVFIEFDSLGWSPADDNRLIMAILELVVAGHADRVLLSHDAGWYQPGQPNGGSQKPYTYLLETFVPKLSQSGLDDGTIEMLTRENPRRAFAFLTRSSEVAIAP